MKNKFLHGAAALALCAAFVGCSEYDQGLSDKAIPNQEKAKFTDQFLKTYGSVAENHDWGFSSNSNDNATRGCTEATGGIGWPPYVTPAPITDSEREAVLKEFQKKRENATNTVEFNYENYFVQQVYTGQTPYYDYNGTLTTPAQIMNEFMCWNYTSNKFEHVNGFNNATCKDKINGANLMENMGTGDRLNDQFCYSGTQNGLMFRTSYIILEINGEYYLGFDVWSKAPEGQEDNKNMYVDRDWVFDDWIVKLVPAKYDMTDENARCVIAEDLAAAVSDFDYNDVVFEAYVKNDYVQELGSNKLVAYVNLLAAGGTMPLYIGEKEVHGLFGVSTSTLVNVGAKSVKKSPVTIKVILGDADWNCDFVQKINEIPVRVEPQGGEAYTLFVQAGTPAEKVAVPIGFNWTDESERLDSKYPKFKDYVGNPTLQWWN